MKRAFRSVEKPILAMLFPHALVGREKAAGRRAFALSIYNSAAGSSLFPVGEHQENTDSRRDAEAQRLLFG